MRDALRRCDVQAEISAGRQLPCICDRQHDRISSRTGKPVQGSGVTARAVGFSTSRGALHEQVECNGCPRTWKRIHG